MQVTIETRSPSEAAADVLALPLATLDPKHWRLPPRGAALDRAAGGRIAQAIAAGDLTGKRGETFLLHPGSALAAKRVLLVGLGDEATLGSDGWRETAALVVREARQRRYSVVRVPLAAATTTTAARSARR